MIAFEMYQINTNKEGKKEVMKLKIETLPNYRLAYMRRVGQYGLANIEIMEQLKNGLRSKIFLNLQSYLQFHKIIQKQLFLITVDLMLNKKSFNKSL